jgi:hypothetical protein
MMAEMLFFHEFRTFSHLSSMDKNGGRTSKDAGWLIVSHEEKK